MVSVAGRPAIGWILYDLLAKGIRRVVAVLHENDRGLAAFIERVYGKRMGTCCIAMPGRPTLPGALQGALSKVELSAPIRVLIAHSLSATRSTLPRTPSTWPR